MTLQAMSSGGLVHGLSQPGMTRTCNLLLRRHLAMLRGQSFSLIATSSLRTNGVCDTADFNLLPCSQSIIGAGKLHVVPWQ